MAETRTYQGATYTRNSPTEPWTRVDAPAQRGILIADPYRAAEEERKVSEEQRRNQDQQFEAQRLEFARLAAETAARNADTAQSNAGKAPDGYRWDANGNLQIIPGGPADKPADGAAKNEGRGTKLRTLLQQIDRVEELYRGNFAGGMPNAITGRVPAIVRPENDQFTSSSASMAEQGLAAFRVPGVGSQSDTELRQFVEANRPLATDSDLAIEEKLRALRLRANAELADLESPVASIAPPPPPSGGAGFGATSEGVPINPEYQAEYEAFVRGGNFTPESYNQFRQQLDAKYNYAPGADYMAEGQRIADQLKAGGPLRLAIPPITQEMSGLDQLRNDAVSNPVGAFFASAGNAGGFGIPSLLAGDQMDALREQNPVSAFMGEIGGGITGTMTGGALLGQVAKSAALSPRAASILANPMTADVGYGSIYGATQADDPLYGAVVGGGAAGLGNIIGGQIAKRAPGLVGKSRPDDTLSRGERAVYDAASRTGQDEVAAALMQAQELGVPAGLADVSPDVNSLTGAALRRSPTAAGDARVALDARGRGQYDRLNDAIARDLGPIMDIPQRSENLIAQARAKAGPLYDAAYAAPGAGAINLEDILARPSMQRALSNARRIAAEEGRDPTTLGFDLDEYGNVLLTRVPSWQTIDYAKRGLDDVLEGYRDPTTGRLVLDTEGQAIDQTRREFLGRVDTINPDYAAARAAYAGPAGEREAMQRGMGAVRMAPNELSAAMRRASPSQQDQMRLGFQSQLAENAGRVRQSTNPFDATLGTPNMEQRLAAMYPDSGDEIARLLAQRDLERQVAGSTNRLVGNSMTAERQLADEAFGQQSITGDMLQGAAETAVTGAPVATVLRSAAGRGMGQVVRDYRTLGFGRNARELADEIAPLALNLDPASSAASLVEMAKKDEAYQQILDALIETARVRGGHVGAGIGATSAITPMR